MQIKNKAGPPKGRKEIFDKFRDKYDLDHEDLCRYKLGPAMGNAKKQAVISLAAAAVGMLIYITYRFEFKFGIAATAACFTMCLCAGGV